jgi:hypothetical protein
MEVYKTNFDGEVKVISKNGNTCEIVFLNTGYRRTANIDNVKVGKVQDHSVRRKYTEWEDSGEVIESNSSGKATILKVRGKECIIQFEETGFIRKANTDNVRDGKVKDPYFKSCYAVGYSGEYPKVTYWKQAKQLWRNMLKRCYCQSDSRGYYGSVTVDVRWLCFANFLEDLPELENFDLWLMGQNLNSSKYNLDKDLKIKGNKVYSREACMFISEYENKSAGARNGKPFTKQIRVDSELTTAV